MGIRPASASNPSVTTTTMRKLWLVKLEDAVDLVGRERVQLHHFCLRAERRWDDVSGLLLAVDLNQHPRLVLPVPASPVRAAQEMGACPEEDVHDPSALQRGCFVGDLNQESFCHE